MAGSSAPAAPARGGLWTLVTVALPFLWYLYVSMTAAETSAAPARRDCPPGGGGSGGGGGFFAALSSVSGASSSGGGGALAKSGGAPATSASQLVAPEGASGWGTPVGGTPPAADRPLTPAEIRALVPDGLATTLAQWPADAPLQPLFGRCWTLRPPADAGGVRPENGDEMAYHICFGDRVRQVLHPKLENNAVTGSFAGWERDAGGK
jgi:hypothetical protein